MEPATLTRAIEAAKATAAALGLRADDVTVLNDSNRLTARLHPCDAIVRVAGEELRAGAEFEVEVVRRLTELECPVATLDPRTEPRVHAHDGFSVTFWTYYESVPPEDAAPAEFADALQRLHAGLRLIQLPAPHFSERAATALAIVDDPHRSPDLADADRELLGRALREVICSASEHGAPEQLLHGEPHPGNVLRSRQGLLFTDFETSRHGPVEFDIAWYARVRPRAWLVDAANPDAVGALYPGADRQLIQTCWIMMQAIIAAWRFEKDDRFPDQAERRAEWLALVRTAVERYLSGAAG